MPRDRNSSSNPVIAPKRAAGGARPRTWPCPSLPAERTRACGSHLPIFTVPSLRRRFEGDQDDQLITTDVALLQSRPLESEYPIVHSDAMWLTVGGGASWRTRLPWGCRRNHGGPLRSSPEAAKSPTPRTRSNSQLPAAEVDQNQELISRQRGRLKLVYLGIGNIETRAEAACEPALWAGTR